MEKLKSLYTKFDKRLERMLIGKSATAIVAASFGAGVLVSIIIAWVF